MAYSSAAERLTVNQNVPGSIPGGPVGSRYADSIERRQTWVNSTAVVHLLYTERVGGSIPSSPIINLHIGTKNDYSKMQRV